MGPWTNDEHQQDKHHGRVRVSLGISKALLTLSVSVVAVHGLGSNPDTAWLGNHSRANWLADYLPTTYKSFRIIAVNHDSRWDAYSPVQSLRDYGQVILDSIAALRLDEAVRAMKYINTSS